VFTVSPGRTRASLGVLPWLIAAIAISHHAGESSALHAATWQYLGEAPDVRPVARTLPLTAEPPEDLAGEPPLPPAESAEPSRRYAQVRYGSENSRRVIVIVDPRTGGEFDLYVDRDRDRIVAPHERIEGSGRERRLEMDCEIIHEDTIQQFARQVELRLGATGDRLSVATLGCVAGDVELDSPANSPPARLAAQRIDGNANGLFADSRDRLRVDLNGDGRFDAVGEQFAWLPVQTLFGRRYAVKADRQGTSLSLEEITGTGQLQVVAARLPDSARISAFEAMVYSDDGSAWSLKESGRLQEVPVGRYTLGSVTLTIDTGEREPWHFVFSRNGLPDADGWVEVVADQQVSLEAVGETSFVLDGLQEFARPGDQVTVNPRLYTQGGLLVNLSSRGRHVGSFDNDRTHNSCAIRLVSGAGETLSSARSGFA
jgi:hypothetical protein